MATLAGPLAAAIGAATGVATGVAAMAADRGPVLGSMLAVSVMALAVIGVAVMLYPVLARDATTTVRRGWRPATWPPAPPRGPCSWSA